MSKWLYRVGRWAAGFTAQLVITPLGDTAVGDTAVGEAEMSS